MIVKLVDWVANSAYPELLWNFGKLTYFIQPPQQRMNVLVGNWGKVSGIHGHVRCIITGLLEKVCKLNQLLWCQTCHWGQAFINDRFYWRVVRDYWGRFPHYPSGSLDALQWWTVSSKDPPLSHYVARLHCYESWKLEHMILSFLWRVHCNQVI